MERAGDSQLSQTLSALASPTRLALLRALRVPRILAEIEVRPPGREDAAAIARQSVRRHLDVLLEAGVVTSRDVQRERGDTAEFMVNHPAIYAAAEEVRDLARIRPVVEPHLMTAAHAGAPSAASERSRRPALVVVKGLEEGCAYPIQPDPPRRTQWLVGRRRGLDVSLDFDPFVSSENTRILWENGAHHVETLPMSRNGTTVNFEPLPVGQRRRLAHGDLIGVGRSILSYWT